MIGEADGSGGVRLLGHGTHASEGIRNGEVSDLDALSSLLKVHRERDANISISSVTVVAPGGAPFQIFTKICSPDVQ